MERWISCSFVCSSGPKSQGYTRFNLGMAPLSSVGQSQKAIKEEKLARILFQYGGSWYGFVGLKKVQTKIFSGLGAALSRLSLIRLIAVIIG